MNAEVGRERAPNDMFAASLGAAENRHERARAGDCGARGPATGARHPAQLLKIGLTRDAIDNWVKTARLHAMHRGVYLLGHSRLTGGARELAAVLACGPGAVLSHRSAAGLW